MNMASVYTASYSAFTQTTLRYIHAPPSVQFSHYIVVTRTSDTMHYTDEQTNLKLNEKKNRDMKASRGHLMPPLQHLYNRLARCADYSIFLHGK